jgi:hypothetical protein
MPGFLLLHIRQRRGDAVQYALDVDVDCPVPFLDLEAVEWRLRHQPDIVDHDVDTPVRLPGCSPGHFSVALFASTSPPRYWGNTSAVVRSGVFMEDEAGFSAMD